MARVMTSVPTRYRFSIEEYHQMAEAGIFTEDDRIELFDGEIIAMAAIGSPHAKAVSIQHHLLDQALGDRAIVRSQQPILLQPDSEPEPDITVVRARADWYASRHPGPEDIFLIIEVADTSLTYDRDTKIPRYGREGIPESWLWDLNGKRLFVYQDPGPDGYRSVTVLGRGDTVAPAAFPDVRITVDDVL